MFIFSISIEEQAILLNTYSAHKAPKMYSILLYNSLV